MSTETKKAMSLREAAKSDFEKGLRNKLTGWGIICKDRHAKGLSRKARKLRRQNGGE